MAGQYYLYFNLSFFATRFGPRRITGLILNSENGYPALLSRRVRDNTQGYTKNGSNRKDKGP
jgi:hypothetical protein